jgi:hypothetical protein
MQQIELTQEHVVKIMKAYDSLDKEESNAKSCATGIEIVLNVLGIYIDGINWDGGANDAQNNEANGN